MPLRLNKLRIAFFGSAVWSIGASAYLLFSPLTIYEQRSAGSADGSQVVEEITRQATWYQVQGWWGVVVLILFTLIFVLIAWLAVKDHALTLLGMSLLASVLVILAGFSIGLYYLPAVALVIVGWIGLGIHKLFQRKRVTSA